MSETLRADFLRFAQLHSWYKHIDLSGAPFWAYQKRGEQPRNGVHPEVTDLSGMHWWFSRREPEESPSYRFEAGPFLRGREGYEGKVAWGIWIIVEDAGKERFQVWIRERYPEWSEVDWSIRDLDNPILLELYQKEQDRYYTGLLEAIIRSKQLLSSSATVPAT